MSRWPDMPGISRRRAPLPTSVAVDLDGREVRVEVRSPARATRYSLRLPTAGRAPVLTVPPRGHLSEALAFLDRHRPWLAQRLDRQPATVAFAEGALVPFGGVPHRIRHAGGRGTVTVVPGTTGCDAELLVHGAAESLARRVRDFLRREARAAVTEASSRHAATLGVRFSSLTIKDTRSRWGSCSASGGLAYSWRIILAPPDVLDYLAAHEVAHLREMNHSARFWRLVDHLCPGWRQHRDWLKRHGAGLHAYGAEEG